MAERIIEVAELQKSYGSVKAVQGISFYVEQGGLFAFLGPNGAGKSTTIDILCTFLEPDKGEVAVEGNKLGEADDKIRQAIGVVFQDGLLDPLLTVRENMKIRGSLYNSASDLNLSIKKAAEAAGVTEFLDRKYGKLSGGQRRRADIARALVHTPRILILDEPTTGLDPQTRRAIWDTLNKLRAETGMTVFFSTHYMEEADAADYVIILDNGKVAASGTPSSLKAKHSADSLIMKPKSGAEEQLNHQIQQHGFPTEQKPGQIIVKIPDTMQAIPLLNDCEDLIDNFLVTTGTLDDVFINITGRAIRE